MLITKFHGAPLGLKEAPMEPLGGSHRAPWRLKEAPKAAQGSLLGLQGAPKSHPNRVSVKHSTSHNSHPARILAGCDVWEAECLTDTQLGWKLDAIRSTNAPQEGAMPPIDSSRDSGVTYIIIYA